jgi:RNA polymerase sigma factor (TIGR02999 family)
VLLKRVSDGDSEAKNALLDRIYPVLRDVAANQMRAERQDHTLQPTALANEVYLRIFGTGQVWQNRVHFFAAASQTIRRILVEHARARARKKRGGGNRKERLESVTFAESNDAIDLIALDHAMSKLAALYPRQADVVNLRFFGGLKMEEIAEAMSVSLRTVESDWRVARLWLARELQASE